MAITNLHSYLVHPGKNIPEAERAEIHGTTLPRNGKLYEMLKRIYDRSPTECTTAVSFTSDDQTNEARNLIVSYAGRPRLDTGQKLAERLQSFTDGTPGMGLLFLVRGQENGKTRTLISRFPADVGILAEADNQGLNIEYLEKVFMRNSNKYKAAMYEDTSVAAGYWRGHVVDNQISYGVVRSVSDYWVIDFLKSDCLTTPKLGSSRLAKMLGEAIKAADDRAVKDELVSAAKLAPNLSGRRVSPASVARRFHLSDAAEELLKDQSKTDELYTEEFVLDRDAFSEVLSYESVELSSGAVLSAPSSEFDELFTREVIDEENGIVRYQTEGAQSDHRFRKVKP
ncbi:MAG: hypothetical protein Aurels2KO_55470 [Aureliella sp.]